MPLKAVLVDDVWKLVVVSGELSTGEDCCCGCAWTWDAAPPFEGGAQIYAQLDAKPVIWSGNTNDPLGMGYDPTNLSWEPATVGRIYTGTQLTGEHTIRVWFSVTTAFDLGANPFATGASAFEGDISFIVGETEYCDGVTNYIVIPEDSIVVSEDSQEEFEGGLLFNFSCTPCDPGSE